MIARLFVVILAALGTCGCGSGLDAAQQLEVSAYAGQQIQCVTLATDREHADQCRQAVKAYWCGHGGPLHEAGACDYSAASVTVVTVRDGGQ